MSRRPLRAVCIAAVLVPALVTAGPVPGAHAEPTGPGESVGALLTRLQGLYQKAEEATEAYNATEAALGTRLGEERRLLTELGKVRTALGSEKAAAGRLAREQYQGSRGLSPYARMLLAGDPRVALDQRRLLAREGARRAGVLERLARGEREAGALAGQARKALDAEQTLAAERKRHKDEVASQLREVERTLASLTPAQLTQLDARETAETAAAQRKLVDSGRLGSPGVAAARTPTAAGGVALTYAAAQIGKPYVWGAEGPGSFDCSGLTSQAWARAGRSIPRTSQEQWAQLPKVPLDRLRPGDLVVYFPKATHVGLYVGGGKVIQAPRPGARVKVSPIAANPLLGAVRPDPDGAPLDHFVPPPLPEGASAGDDAGYSAEEAPTDGASDGAPDGESASGAGAAEDAAAATSAR
ncbi:NlpC/P60 family protein [Streptomyces xanthophaeus]|uniref:C40 family peptidase n=1 Tax=Streptomyces xanthophaeus TaxID=67385 RepID=UPI003865F845|nr:NlpC/P60 family protein [Streptomyces xanthophaeus]WST60371.1 NlpC/P60 family protein [Streptomyces xanthophaeus]